jgi:hypothetical protein
VGVTPEGILSVHQWQGIELDRGGGDNVATRHAWACQLTLPRHVNGRLRPGLDGMLSAPVARSVKWATRGPHRRAVGSGFRAAQ